MRQHAQAVFAVPRRYLGRGDPMTIFELRIQRHGVLFFRQIFADDADRCDMIESFAECSMMFWAPRNRAVEVSGHRRTQRTRPAGDLHVVAPHETPRTIRFVKLLAQDAASMRSFVTVQPLIETTWYETERMEHEVLAHQPAAVGEAVGKPCRRGVQQNARGADAVARQDDHLSTLKAFLAVFVVINDTVRETSFVQRDLAHT